MEIAGLLTEISIALVAINIAVYAIAAALLGSQLKRNFIYIQRRLEEAEAEIQRTKEYSSSPRQRLEKVDAEVKKFKKEEKALQDKLFCLTLKGAVLYPCCLFAFSIILIAAASLFFPPYVYLTAIPAIVLLSWGSYRIYRTLLSIDYAAINIPLPIFEATFSDDEQKTEMEPAKRQTLSIAVSNSGYDVGEMMEVSVFFPPSFKVAESPDYEIYVQPEKDNVYPLYTGVFFELDCLHVDTTVIFDISITSSKEPHAYKIPVYVNERKITQKAFELEIVVRKPTGTKEN